MIRENVKISAKGSPGYNEGWSKLLEQRKEAKLQKWG
jgi:hypothetical protein